MELNDFLHAAVDSGASDILLVTGSPPMFRINGELQPAHLEALTPLVLEELCRQTVSEEQFAVLDQHQDLDFSLSIPQLGRFRFNIHRQRNSYAAAIRYVAGEIPRLEDLQLPPAIEQLTFLKHGLILVTGPTGSGKTTTLAAMLDAINRRESRHIITLEDPIEYQFTHERSLVEQREIGVDCPSFSSGLRHVLRQDPDVILVGELRDLETIRTAMQAAETGHLVLATLHASTASGTIDRVIEVFPPEEQSQVRTHLSESLRAVVTQRLLPAADGRGRVAATEILIVNRAIATNIREGSSHLIAGAISTQRRAGMQTMQQSMEELVLNGRILPEAIEEQQEQERPVPQPV